MLGRECDCGWAAHGGVDHNGSTDKFRASHHRSNPKSILGDLRRIESASVVANHDAETAINFLVQRS